MLDDATKALVKLALFRLSGYQAVKLIWQPPPEAGPDGSLALGAARRYGGRLVVHLDPKQTDMTLLQTLTHEAEHIHRHWPQMRSSDVDPARAPGSVRLSAEYLSRPAVTSQEGEAEAGAAGWLDYADKIAWRYPGGWLERRLRALADWTPDFEPIIRRAVSDALNKTKG